MRKPTLRTDAGALLEACPGVLARVAARRITRVLDRALAPTGLGAAQLALLAQIAVAKDDRMAALAQRAGLDPSTLSRNLRRLEAEGLVEIASVEADLRRRAVWLTESGARRLEAALPLWRAAQAEVARHVEAAPARRLAAQAEALET
ncbi:MarR family transcriptional regulator [Falsiroseomonas bella]|uniref:MarR family transcriptional regulator n=1 Tax=Falsiroseomonas bella TaxID=2184016 RepID=A0A317F6H2_9PROT|nr:MarR family winged helix-turn-helix transcriptional regulator [Falsiroseomonas bella]PWS33993.1 MarR family transcriptional regulator [Falsiroseomonas bella]